MTAKELRSVILYSKEAEKNDINITQSSNSQASILDKCACCIDSCYSETVQSTMRNILNYSYDCITICISLADVTTDIWVIYNFKSQKRETFFLLSLIVMIMAQLSYVIAFVLRFGHYATIGGKLCLFLIILPFAPLASFIFFTLAFENNWIARCMKCINSSFDDKYETKYQTNGAPIVVWVEKKFQKHIGFVLEALVEALPQSIIQLIAIVYYQDTEILNVISICISLTSVATKTLVFSLAIDFRVFIFNWLSLVSDFFGVFAVVSWVFYNPNNPGKITYLSQIWIVKAVVVWILVSFFSGGFFCCIYFWVDVKANIGKTHGARLRINGGWFGLLKNCTPYFLKYFILWLFGCTFGVVLSEIVLFSPFAFISWSIAHQRYTEAEISISGKKLFDFVLDCKSMYSIIDIEDKNEKPKLSKENQVKFKELKLDGMDHDSKVSNYNYNYNYKVSYRQRRHLLTGEAREFRVIYANYCLISKYQMTKDSGIEEHLNKNIENGWSDVTMETLRQNCALPENGLWYKEFFDVWENIIGYEHRAWNTVKEEWDDDRAYWYEVIALGFRLVYVYFLCWIVFPLFCLSRIFSMFFPIIAIIYWDFDVKDIQLLQWLLTIVYGILVICWIISFVRCMDFYYWTTHLFPGDRSGQVTDINERRWNLIRLNLMQKYYDKWVNQVFIEKERIKMVIEILGTDIGGLIVSFWPKFHLKQVLDQMGHEYGRIDKEYFFMRGYVGQEEAAVNHYRNLRC